MTLQLIVDEADRPKPASLFARGDHVELAAHLIDRVQTSVGESIMPCVYDDGEMYRYSGPSGLWVALARAELSCIVQSFAGTPSPDKPLKLKASDISGTIACAKDRASKPGYFADAPEGMVFADRFVRVTPERIIDEPHQPSNRARYGYPFAYTADPPRQWISMLQAAFKYDADQTERIAFLQEFFGACILGIAPRFQRCFVAVGGGANGKSKIGDVITAAMPRGSTCAVPPQSWSDEYRRALLAGKRFNIVSELPESDIIDSEPVKAIIDGSLIDARPIREAPFSFRPVAGHYFAANRLPGTNDQTHAFWRRLVILRFNRSFSGDPDADPECANRVITTELAKVVGWMLDGGRRLLARGAYTLPASHFAELNEWRRNADPVSLFLEETCDRLTDGRRPTENDRAGWTASQELYDAYVQWTKRNGHRAMAHNKFGGRLGEAGLDHHKLPTGMTYSCRIRAPKTNGYQ